MNQTINSEQKFFITDDGLVPQWVEVKSESEFLIVEVDPNYGGYIIKENNINLNDFSEEEILNDIKPFGYSSISNLMDLYGADSYQQIVAECIAESRTPDESDTTYIVEKPNILKEKLKELYNIDWTNGDSWFEDH